MESLKKGLDKFIKIYCEVLYAFSAVFYVGFAFCVLVQVVRQLAGRLWGRDTPAEENA